jgi:hypothetical protein
MAGMKKLILLIAVLALQNPPAATDKIEGLRNAVRVSSGL